MDVDLSAVVDGITWPDAVTAAVAVAALVVSLRSVRHSKRAADANEKMAAATVDAVRAAQNSAREAADMARNDREREHDRRGPGPVPTIVAELESGRPGMPRTLVGEITVPRGYRVRAEAVTAQGAYSTVSLDQVLHPGRAYRFQIEQLPAGRTAPVTAHVLFRFWPPVETDDVEMWRCPCERPAVEGNATSRGHWEWRAPVRFELPPRFQVR